MDSLYKEMELLTESDVEQKFIYKLLTNDEPSGLAYLDSDFRTKVNIKKIAIDKGVNKKLYYPDYAIILNGLPVVIIEAKTPGEDIEEAVRQARLYATEVNSSYPRNINPCERILVTDGKILVAAYWDVDEPYATVVADNFEPLNPDFSKLISFLSKKAVNRRANEILKGIKSSARYFKPIYMLGGKAVINETVGENTFGANISVEYKYLFNPSSPEDREAIVHNAYVKSRRKQSHVAPIDRIIRAAIPSHMNDAIVVEDTENPVEIFEQLGDVKRISNEICILIGSVGSGKSTFTDYLRIEALPESVRKSTEWIHLDLNKAPLSREYIYKWVVDESIKKIRLNHKEIDFDEINTLKKVYSRELTKIEKGKAALFPKDSERYVEVVFDEINMLQADSDATLDGMMNMLHKKNGMALVIVLDNCDKRNRDDQLLMFEVASWLKSNFECMIFLPIRDTTYDQFRDEPPLDTVIKDLVFRIDPPLLEKVIYSRLSYAVREIEDQSSKFVYSLPNNMRVECDRGEVEKYLKAIISSLFQDKLFKRIIVGLAGRNIRKGLEIILDFCKSGHIASDEILKVRGSDGDYRLPHHLIAKILMKGKRKHYSDTDSHIKNILSSCDEDPLPDPFVRVSILEWLKDGFREYGPNRTKGFHKVSNIVGALQSYGHSAERVVLELSELVHAGCINSESQTNDIEMDDLISIAPSGFVHLELLKNINYLSAISEDVYFRENQVAKSISDNMVGRSKFKVDSRQAAISNSKILMDYMDSYYQNYFVGSAKVLTDDDSNTFSYLLSVCEYVNHVADNDRLFVEAEKTEKEYPPGMLVEAQIVSFQDYGFFVEFGLTGTGLVHKSNYNGLDIDDEHEIGDWVIVEVVQFNNDHGRFALKLIDI